MFLCYSSWGSEQARREGRNDGVAAVVCCWNGIVLVICGVHERSYLTCLIDELDGVKLGGICRGS
jgi:hypothetical protein